jgi:Zn-dependent protease/CBS domain-containing protein
MKWSWKVGQLAGIDLRIHTTFLLLLGWLGAVHWMAGRNMHALVAGLAFIVALFACVLFHEMGHALAARRFGIQTRDITLLPIGGLARLERIPEEPKQELWIALAGPAVNVAIAVGLYAWLTLTLEWEPFGRLGITTGPFVERLLFANISLVLFNLIPAFPMDGGRVLRALLAFRMTYPKATQTAALTGQAIAVIFGFAGAFMNPMLLFIAVFVWIGASQEARAVQMKSALSGVPARAMMLTEFERLQSGDTLADAVRLTLKGSQHDYPVVEFGMVIGILTRADLLSALAEHGDDYPVTLAMRHEFPVAEPAEMLVSALQRLHESDSDVMPVVHDGELIGLVTMDHLSGYLRIEETLQKRDGRSGLAGQTASHSLDLSGSRPTLSRGIERDPQQSLSEDEAQVNRTGG